MVFVSFLILLAATCETILCVGGLCWARVSGSWARQCSFRVNSIGHDRLAIPKTITICKTRSSHVINSC